MTEQQKEQLLIEIVQEFIRTYEDDLSISSSFYEVVQEVGKSKYKEFDDEEYVMWLLNKEV